MTCTSSIRHIFCLAFDMIVLFLFYLDFYDAFIASMTSNTTAIAPVIVSAAMHHHSSLLRSVVQSSVVGTRVMRRRSLPSPSLAKTPTEAAARPSGARSPRPERERERERGGGERPLHGVLELRIGFG